MLGLLLVILSLLHCMEIPKFTIDPEKTTLSRAVFAALTFHVNLLEIEVGYLPANWDVLWSLSIEEFFYSGFRSSALRSAESCARSQLPVH